MARRDSHVLLHDCFSGLGEDAVHRRVKILRAVQRDTRFNVPAVLLLARANRGLASRRFRSLHNRSHETFPGAHFLRGFHAVQVKGGATHWDEKPDDGFCGYLDFGFQGFRFDIWVNATKGLHDLDMQHKWRVAKIGQQ